MVALLRMPRAMPRSAAIGAMTLPAPRSAGRSRTSTPLPPASSSARSWRERACRAGHARLRRDDALWRTALGARRETMTGLSGLGDLILTCGSPQSRNMSLGSALGEGRSLGEVLKSRLSVTEGCTPRAPWCEIAAARGIEMPIAQAVHAVVSGLATVRRGNRSPARQAAQARRLARAGVDSSPRSGIASSAKRERNALRFDLHRQAKQPRHPQGEASRACRVPAKASAIRSSSPVPSPRLTAKP